MLAKILKSKAGFLAGLAALASSGCFPAPTWRGSDIIRSEVHEGYVIEYIKRDIHDGGKYDLIVIYILKDGEVVGEPWIYDLNEKKAYSNRELRDYVADSRNLNR